MKRMSCVMGMVVLCLAFAGCTPKKTVPNVAGLTQAAAERTIVGTGLVIGTITQAYSATVPAGAVISQTPAGDTLAGPGSAVDLVVSKGPEIVTVPNVVGQTQAAAASTITGGGLMVGTVTEIFSATVPLGAVISQMPAAGESAPPGTAVNLAVSKGPQPPVVVPNVVGRAQAAASAAITNAGLTVGAFTEEYSPTVPSGSVISQNPVAGVSVPPGTAVALAVSMGPQPVAVPDVMGQAQAAAFATITAAGLTVGAITEEYSPIVPSDSIISQNPAAGASVPPGTAVALTVSMGPQPVAVPDVVGQAQAAAFAAITAADLTVGAITEEYSSTVPSGSVISQDPAAGASVAPGTAVNLDVSKGPQPPQAAFQVAASSGTAPLTVAFQDLSVVGDCPIDSWQWEFGDGFLSAERNPIYTYKVPGTYTVTLIITNRRGSDTASRANLIVVSAGVADSDGDGATDSEEAIRGTDPANPQDGGGLIAPASPTPEVVDGGGTQATIEKAEYSLHADRLAQGLGGNASDYTLVGGLDAYNKTVAKGAATMLKDYLPKAGTYAVALNTSATALLQIKTAANKPLLYVLFPKGTDLRVTSPSFDFIDCAAAIIYSQPLLLRDNPVYTAVMLQIIKQLPETRTLAGLLAAKCASTPDIMVNPDAEVMGAVANATGALMVLAENRSKHLHKAIENGQVSEKYLKLIEADKDTCSAEFCDMDGRDGDKVDVRAAFSGSTGSFNLTNHLTRWVTFYTDSNAGGHPAFDGSYAGIVEPRKFAPPTIKDLVIDAILNNLGGVVWGLFTGNTAELLPNTLDRAVASVTSHFAPGTNDFQAAISWADAVFSSYSIGRGTGVEDNGRCAGPAVLTVATELVLPLVSVAMDMDSTVVVTKNGIIHNFTSTAALLTDLGGSYGADLAGIVLAVGSGGSSTLQGAGDCLDIAEDMALDPVLWEYLSRNGPLGSAVIQSACADAVQGALGRVFSPLEWVGTGVNVVNLCLAACNFIEVVVTEDQMDAYRITAEEPAVSPTVSSFQINGGASVVTDRTVTLNNICAGSPTDYKASELTDFSDASWQPYSTAPSFTITSSGNGMKTVYFKVRNAVDESPPVSDTITLNENTGTDETVLLPGGVPLEMVWVPGGTFTMGSPNTEQGRYSDEGPQYSVTLNGFWMGKYELTKRQWTAVVGTTPWSGCSYVLADPDSPAVYVSWNDAQSFLTAVNSYTGKAFGLPSEAQWEYACRSGTTTRFYWGDDPSYTVLGDYAWYDGNAWFAGQQYAHMAGTKLPNAFGLYDMSGNLWEWCEDDCHDSYMGAPVGGQPWVDSPRASYRALRGGGWYHSNSNCRSAYRGNERPDSTDYGIGFRVARTP